MGMHGRAWASVRFESCKLCGRLAIGICTVRPMPSVTPTYSAPVDKSEVKYPSTLLYQCLPDTQGFIGSLARAVGYGRWVAVGSTGTVTMNQ